MAAESREWADIDTAWLQDYLERHQLATGYDLEDALLGAQVSWLLSDDEWASLRRAWEGTDAAKLRVRKEEMPDPTIQADEKAGSPTEEEFATAAPEENDQTPADPEWLSAEIEKRTDQERQRQELIRAALTDWAAFQELFRDCPDSASFRAWASLAETPLALLKHGEDLIQSRAAEIEEKKRKVEREFEENVSRAQNVIAGYFMYCRKHRLVPSMDHLIRFIPAIKTGHKPEAVKEAWKRESGI